MGGADLACQRLFGWTCIGYIDSDSHCQGLLAARIEREDLDLAPIFTDIGLFTNQIAPIYRGVCQCVVAGFPCQPFSAANMFAGDPATNPGNLWPELETLIRLLRPEFVLLENVATIISRNYIGRIFGELASMGYDSEWGCASAKTGGAPHRRDRLWIASHLPDAKSQ